MQLDVSGPSACGTSVVVNVPSHDMHRELIVPNSSGALCVEQVP